MNAIEQNLSLASPAFLRSIVWPIFWQSSLLIGLLFLLDFSLSRRLRPAVRYAFGWCCW